jgi:hypothetical protein
MKKNIFFALIILIALGACKQNKNPQDNWFPSPTAYDMISIPQLDSIIIENGIIYRGITPKNDTVFNAVKSGDLYIDLQKQMYFGVEDADTCRNQNYHLTHIHIQGLRILNLPLIVGEDRIATPEEYGFDWIKFDPYGSEERSSEEQEILKKNKKKLDEFIRLVNKYCKPSAFNQRYVG